MKKPKDLEKLKKALTKPTSASLLSKQLRWSLATIYRGIDRLMEKGSVIAEVRTPWKKRGPTPKQFILVKDKGRSENV